jgi:hypothetical protein
MKAEDLPMPSAETVVCPYCNAFVPVPTDAAAGRRLTCPRCGEAFAFLPRDAVTGSLPVAAAMPNSPTSFSAEPPATDTPAMDSMRTKVRLLLRILSVMAVVLLIVGGSYINSLVANGATVDAATFAGVAVPLVVLWLAVSGVAFLWLWFFRVPRSNGATSLFILANMVALALLTLGGALATQSYRRHIDAGLPARPKRSPLPEDIPAGPDAVAPTHLAALEYLPPKIDLLAGVHVAELMEDPVGKKLINEPLKFGNTEVRLADFPGKIGLGVHDLDHFVVGMRVDEPLSVVFVIRTKQAYDGHKVREALHARSLPGAGRTLYEATFPAGNLPALLWCADERTLLIGLARESLEKANVPGEGKPDALAPEVREVLNTRVRPLAQLWVVGHSTDWTKTAASLLLSRLPAEWQERLVAAHTFAIWTAVDGKTVTLNAVARCDDDRAAEKLENWLADRGGKNAPRFARDGNWLSLQRSMDADAFRSLFAP